MIDNEGLKREIGVWGLVSNSINIIVGAGIFLLPVLVFERLGTGSVLAFVVCGFLMMLIMLSFAEIGTQITKTGGAYSYIEEAFGKYAGFLTTNIFIFGAAVMANAAVGNGLADTLAYFFPFFENQWARGILFFVLFGGLAYVNVKGVSKAMSLVKITTIAKLTPLILIVIFGWIFIKPSNLTWTTTPTVMDLGEMSLMLIFAFVGAETALNVGGEIKNPRKTIPKGIVLSIAAVLILYIGIQLVVQGILGASMLDFRSAPIAEVAMRIIGPIGATIVIIGASFSMFGNLSGMTLNMPRVLYAAARDNVMPPKILAHIHSKYATPNVSIIVYAGLGFLFATIGEFKQLAILSSASYLLIYLGVVLSVIKFKITGKMEKDTYQTPGGYLIPVVSTIVIGWFLTNLAWTELKAMLIFIGILTAIYLAIIIFKKGKAKNNL